MSVAVKLFDANEPDKFTFDERKLACDSFPPLAKILAGRGDIFRPNPPEPGLIRVSGDQAVDVLTAKALMGLIADTLQRFAAISGNGKEKPTISGSLLNVMLESEIFRGEFRVLDSVITQPAYLDNFELTPEGYSDSGPGRRVFYVPRGDTGLVSSDTEAITKFVDTLFDTPVAKTHWTAMALTVLLHQFWPGGRPLFCFIGDKSHVGKTTSAIGACTSHKYVTLSYQATSWAIEQNIARLLNTSPDATVLIVDNARTGGRQEPIASASLERALTDERPNFFSSGKGESTCRRDLVFALTSNQNQINADLLNRSVLIPLRCVGDTNARHSEIGNPRWDFLAMYRHQMAAELRGMVAKWVSEGKLPDDDARHSCAIWARTIGGILKTNGFEGFLSNHIEVRQTQDALREALAVLGVSRPDKWLRIGDWVKQMDDQGLTQILIGSSAARKSLELTKIHLGRVLTAHQDIPLQLNTDDAGQVRGVWRKQQLWIAIEGKETKQPRWGYRFELLE